MCPGWVTQQRGDTEEETEGWRGVCGSPGVAKAPQTGRLKTTELYSVAVPEDEGLESRCPWGHAPSDT